MDVVEEFNIIINQLKTVTISYYIFRTLYDFRTSREDIYKYYKSFFYATEMSHTKSFVIGITNIFDESYYYGIKIPFSIKRLIDIINFGKSELDFLKITYKNALDDVWKIRNENFAHLDPAGINW